LKANPEIASLSLRYLEAGKRLPLRAFEAHRNDFRIQKGWALNHKGTEVAEVFIYVIGEKIQMAVYLFISAVCLELIYTLLFILTIRRPGFRFWPPPKAFSWQFFLAWLMAGVVGAFCLFLGLLDYNSGFLPHILLRLPFAPVFSLVGTAIGCWGAAVFNLRSTLGLGKRLVTRGPYQFTRNPQCLCDSLNALGFMMLFDPSTESGARIQKRLQNDKIIWLTTVAADGTPQPNPTQSGSYGTANPSCSTASPPPAASRTLLAARACP